MRKITHLTIAFTAFCLLASCAEEKESVSGRTSDRQIGIGNVQVVPSVITKSNGQLNLETTIEDEAQGLSLSVSETIEPIDVSIETKAGEITTDNLKKDNAFWIDGFYGPELASTKYSEVEPHFITKGAASYNTSEGIWDIADSPQWRDQINHYFWAYSPSTLSFSPDLTADGGASFTYTTDLNEDVILAHRKQWWDMTLCPYPNQTNKDIIDYLYFKHALAGIDISANFEYYVKNILTGEVTESTGSVQSISFNSNTTGTCAVSNAYDDGIGFTWNGQTNIQNSGDVSGKTNFVIPQGVTNNAVILSIKDEWGNTHPVTLDFPTSFVKDEKTSTHSSWVEGNKYSYKYSGKLTALVTNENGMEFDFEQKAYKAEAGIANIDISHLSTVDISWDGSPIPQGANTYIYIALLDPSCTEKFITGIDGDGNHIYNSDLIHSFFPDLSGPVNTQFYSYILFAAVIDSNGNVTIQPTYQNVANEDYSCTKTGDHYLLDNVNFDIMNLYNVATFPGKNQEPKFGSTRLNNATMFVAYYGSANKPGDGCSWHIKNFKIDVNNVK